MIEITKMLAGHWQDVKEIYEQGIQTGNATFELEAPGWDVWDNAHLQHSRLVAFKENKMADPDYFYEVIDECKLDYRDIYIPRNSN